MGYDAITMIGPNLARKVGVKAPPGFKHTGHSFRRAANTIAFQHGATERQREKRFGYAQGSTAMRRYEQPGQAAIRMENLTTFAIGPNIPQAVQASQLALQIGPLAPLQVPSDPEHSGLIMPQVIMPIGGPVIPEQALETWELDTVPSSPYLLSPAQDQQLQIALEPPGVIRRRLPFTNQAVVPETDRVRHQGGMTIDLRNNTGTITLQLGSQAAPFFLG